MNNFCDICNKHFNSNSGYYKHNKCHHPNVFTKDKKTEQTKCIFCEKELSSYGCKWRHEKTCKYNTNQEDMLRNKIRKEVQKELNNLKYQLKTTQPSTVTNNTTNNTTNNNTQNVICVFPLGNEPTNTLSIEYIKQVLSEHGINSVMEIVKKKHFNPTKPECQNFCVTALNNNYASVVDPETKTIKSVNKKDVFARLIRICKNKF
jgi:hypothetical protein